MKNIIQKTKYALTALVIMTGFSFVFLSPTASARLFDGAKEQACAGAQLSQSASVDCTQDDENRLSTTIGDAVNLLSVIVGIIAVIMIIIGGMRFILSDGDSGKVTSARNTIMYALIGLILVAFAQIIVKFILNRV